MRRYQVIEMSEKGLEDWIRRAPEFIEAGLKFVDHQAFTTRGPLDVLLVDSGSALIVAELKVIEDDTMLVQGIDYYDYVLRNLDGFARAYQQHNIDIKQQPRLFLFAPSFSVTLLNRIKWIDIPISLFTFQCVEFEDAKGDVPPIYQRIDSPDLPDPYEGGYRLDDRYNYITDTNIRGLAQKLVEDIQGWDSQRVSVEATKYDISIRLSGRVFAYIGPRRKHFMVYTNDTEGKLTGYSINSEAAIEAVNPLLLANFNKIGGQTAQERS